MSFQQQEFTSFKDHPIQLQQIDLVDVKYSAKLMSDPDVGIESYSIQIQHSEYQEDTHSIDVGLSFKCGEDPDKPDEPFQLRVAIRGRFSLEDPSQFPEDKIIGWARNAAPYVLMPYLREHVYAQSVRSGFKPILLPLVLVPAGVVSVKGQKAEAGQEA